MEDNKVVIIDIGSGTIKAGFVGDEAPSVTFPSIVGRPRQSGVMVGQGRKSAFVGDEAVQKRGVLTLRSPFERGLVTDWDDLTELLRFAFRKLGADPTAQPVLLTEPVLDPKENRQKLAQILFETLQVPAMYLVPAGTLALYAAGRTTGLAIDVGEFVSQIVAVHEGFVLPKASARLAFAGHLVTDYLTKLMASYGYSMTTTAEREIVRDIKEKLAYVAEDFDAEMQRAAASSELERNYELPEGQVVTLGDARFQCAEVLLKPSLCGLEQDGLHIDTYNAIGKAGPELRAQLYGNIVLTGGTSMLPGLCERLQKDIASLAPSSVKVKVVAPENRRYGAFAGASVLASLETFQSTWVTRAEYDETGPAIVDKKCI
ncbi:actin, cytoplasmic 2 [Sorangium sp. So ce321]|uniref:actin, cytoplasmic 2 n=1 Tax=Sorangium sp. So ce321 TaxID=3133300 RepID=UPI003F5EE4C4